MRWDIPRRLFGFQCTTAAPGPHVPAAQVIRIAGLGFRPEPVPRSLTAHLESHKRKVLPPMQQPPRDLGRTFLLPLAVLVLLSPARLSAEPPPEKPSRPVVPRSPLTPEDALRQFQHHPAVRVELVAAEPQIVDPVSIAFDSRGRLWAAEMSDYPNGPLPGERPRSRIRLLEDRDGDGRFETSHVFADGLLFATGVLPWRDGVIATLSGEIAWLADSDGDHRADVKETWFTGFAEENSQLRANHPTLGADGWVYVANGLRGGKVVSRKPEWSHQGQPLDIGGRDFRFHPLTGRYEAISGFGQFGLAFDDFGNRFVCSNRNPCKHVVLADHYLKRNPHLAVRAVEHDVSPAAEASRIFPISRAWTTSTLHAGQFTAACGVLIYRGDALPVEFRGNSFTCDPTGNLVHRDVLEPAGATFRSRPGRQGVEFLATADEWFRAVDLAHGPDGALYVVDMYRAVIEHPQFMPEELKQRPDLYHGDDRGRIYRIVAAEPQLQPRREAPVHLADMAAASLAALLEHSNCWQRETAAQLLYERQDVSVRDRVEVVAARGKTPDARVQALELLKGLNLLTADLVGRVLNDPDPRVVACGMKLSEPFLGEHAELRDRVAALVEHEDAAVRFQAALSLGAADPRDPAVRAALTAVALRDAADPWTRIAVATAVGGQTGDFLAGLLQTISTAQRSAEAATADMIGEFAEIAGADPDTEALPAVIRWLLAPPRSSSTAWADAAPPAPLRLQLAVVNGLSRGLARRGKNFNAAWRAAAGEQTAAFEAALAEILRQAGEAAQNRRAAQELRLEAVRVLRHAASQTAVPVLKELSLYERDQTVRLEALASLCTFSAPEIGPALLEMFPAETPPIRRAILDGLLADLERARLLLAEIRSGRVKFSELDQTHVARLTRHRDPQIQRETADLVAAAVPEDRRKVLAEYQAALELPGDAMRGRQIFARNCTACHKIGDVGVDVAPDIADSRTKTPQDLLTAILDPNRAVDNNYFSYTVVTKQGRVLTGIISAQTAVSITLKQPEGKTETVLRDEIDEMRSNGISLMPVGVERTISVAEMADLIAFIKNWRYLDGQVPLSSGPPPP